MAGKRKLVVEILGENSSMAGALDDADSKLSRFGDKVTDVGKKMMGIGAGLTVGVTLPIVAFAKSAFSAFSEAEQSNAQMEASLKSTGATAWTSSGQIDKLAQSMQNKLGIDGDLIKSGASVLLTFTNVQNKVGEGNDIFDRATQTAADMSAKLGTDLPAANMLLGKALNEPVTGMAALRRAGVQLSEGQQDLVKQMVETGDVSGAQKILLEELERQFGGSAEAAGNTAAGGMEKLRLKFEDIQESVGERLVPILAKLGDWLQTAMSWWDRLGEKGQTIALVMAGVAAAIGPVVTVVGALVTVIGFLISPVGLVIAAVAALVAAFVYFYKTNEGFREWVDGVVSAVRDRLVTAFNWVKDNILPALEVAFQRISEKVLPMIAAAMAWVSDVALPKLSQAFAWLSEKLGPTVQSLGELVATVFQSVVTSIVTAADVVAGVVKFMADAFEWLQPVISVVWGVIVEQITAAIKVVQGIIKFVTAVIQGDWSGAWNAIKQVAAGIWDGIVSLVRGSVDLVVTLVRGALSAIPDIFSWVWNSALGIMSDAWNGLKFAAAVGVNAVVDFVRGLPGRLGDVFSGAGRWLLDAGRAIMGGLLDGLRDAWERVAGFLGGLAGKIKDLKGPLDYDAKLLIPAGNKIMEGLGDGLRAGWKDVATLVGGMAPELSASISAGAGGGSGGSSGGDTFNFYGPVTQDSARWVMDQIRSAKRQGIPA